MSAHVMTPAQFAERMKEISGIGDSEIAHGEADGLMCWLLGDLGYGEGVEVFVGMEKWHA